MSQRVSANEPVTLLRRVPIQECGEPLVDYTGHPRMFVGGPIWGYERQTLLRESVRDRLWSAADTLPHGFAFSIVEGWRPPHIQERMYLAAWKRWKEIHPDYSDAALRRVVNRFTAPMNDRVPPPHSTGGAVDLVLADEAGAELDMTAPFRRFQARGYAFDAAGLSEDARRNRLIVKAALEGAGITNYPSEFWHWSYGDQGWAYRGGYPAAIYGRTEPVGYEAPEPSHEPLYWVATEKPG